MRCMESGELRAYLDRELTPDRSEAAVAHLTACARCRAVAEELERTATAVEQRLQHIYTESAPLAGREERALAAVQAKIARSRRDRLAGWISETWAGMGGALATRRVAALGGLAALVLLAVMVGTPVGKAAADFIGQFQTQKFKVVTVEPTQVARVGFDLAHFGTVSGPVSGPPAPIFVSSLDEASRRVGFVVKQPAYLPADAKQPAQIGVTAPVSFSFRLDVAKARAHLDATGHKDFDLPARFDGATITVHVPAAALLVYGALTDPFPLVVGEVPVVRAEVTGQVSLAEMRDLVLSLPGISRELAVQLRAIDDWTNTVPILLPKDQASWREIDLGGVKALVLTGTQQTATVVLWQRDGRIHGVAGAYDADELVKVATSLQ